MRIEARPDIAGFIKEEDVRDCRHDVLDGLEEGDNAFMFPLSVFSSDSLMISDFAATRKLFFISDMVRLIFSATKNDVAFISFSMICRMAAECVLYVI